MSTFRKIIAWIKWGASVLDHFAKAFENFPEPPKFNKVVRTGNSVAGGDDTDSGDGAKMDVLENQG
jgi:hypothetical protein